MGTRTHTWILALVGATVGAASCSGDSGTGQTTEVGGTVGDTAATETGGDVPGVFPGLSASVDIVIDTMGVPHIYAKTDADLMYAAGYQVATDRLFQMDLMRRRALGRQAEVLGDAKLDQDRISLLFDVPRWGAANAERLLADDPELYALLTAWLAGVNHRVQEVIDGAVPLPYGFGPDELDYLPERWTMEDHSAIAKLILLGNSNSLEHELLATIVQRTFPATWEAIELVRPAFDVPILPEGERPQPVSASRGLAPLPASPDAPVDRAALAAGVERLHESLGHLPRVGSNNWALAGRHTATGRPIIAGDPHQPLQSPSLMYTQHINSSDAEGTFDVMGWGFVGGAGVHLGHNRKLHWTATTVFADVMDIWEVEVSGTTVRVGDTMVEAVPRIEDVQVAGGESVQFVFEDVPGFGLLVPDDLLPIPVAAPGHRLLLNWTGLRATQEERSFFAMATAQSLEEYDAAADLMLVGGYNFMAASAEGITYRVGIDVPDRGDPSARPMPYTVVSGNDPGALWTGYLPAEKLPHSRGGARGWLASANNDPFGFTFDGDVNNDPWYFGAFFASGFRAHRVSEELNTLVDGGGVTVEDMQTMQTDTQSATFPVLMPLLQEAFAAVGSDDALVEFVDDADLAALVALLGDWDGRMDRESPEALAFHVAVMFFADEVASDDLSLLYGPILDAQAPFLLKIPLLAITGAYPNAAALFDQTPQWHLLRAVQRTAAFLRGRFGSVDPTGYAWGDLHGTDFQNDFGNALALGFVPTDGGEDTINPSSSKFLASTGNPAKRFDSHDGPIFRVVTSFAEDGSIATFANFPPGNSGDPGSPHFADTLEDWVEGRYQRLPFARAEVDAATESVVTLDPADHRGPEN